jgi:hypothetical protein
MCTKYSRAPPSKSIENCWSPGGSWSALDADAAADGIVIATVTAIAVAVEMTNLRTACKVPSVR